MDFDIRIEAERLRPRSRTWQSPVYRSERTKAGPGGESDDRVELEARIDLIEGPPGRARMELHALGCTADPWRFRSISLERDWS